ncbi:MAG TPA: hypothetical protein VIG33_18215, partial [Pseudobdellovibrionaceae bacterium]
FTYQEDFRLARGLSVMLEKLPEKNGKIIIEQRYPRSELFGMPALQNILTTFRCIYLELYWNSSKKLTLIDTIKGLIC